MTSEVRFTDLSFDDVYETLQYLPIIQMVSLLRVNKQWAEILDILILKQKTFGINDPVSGELCQSRDHHITSRNCLPIIYSYSMPRAAKSRLYTAFECIVRKCPNLRAIYCISDDNGFGNALKLVLENCSKLECIKFKHHSLENGSFPASKQSRFVLKHISNVKNLKHISLPYLQNSDLELLFKNNTKIESLSLDFLQGNGKPLIDLPSSVTSCSFSPFFNDNNFYSGNPKPLMHLHQSNAALVKLVLWKIPIAGLPVFVNLRTLIIGTPFKYDVINLKHFEIIREFIHLEELQIVVQELTYIEELDSNICYDMYECSMVNLDNVFHKMFPPGLKTLKLENVIVGNKSLQKLPFLCPELRVLELSYDLESYIPIAVLNANTFICFASMPNLYHVKINRENSITQESLIKFLKIHGLTYLYVNKCKNLSEKTLLQEIHQRINSCV
jgi:hypothetical protein